jgi:hypothetical protein
MDLGIVNYASLSPELGIVGPFIDPRCEDKKFNGSWQQVVLRRTGRPAVGWSGRGVGRAR